jgi:hypothetical protein
MRRERRQKRRTPTPLEHHGIWTTAPRKEPVSEFTSSAVPYGRRRSALHQSDFSPLAYRVREEIAVVQAFSPCRVGRTCRLRASGASASLAVARALATRAEVGRSALHQIIHVSMSGRSQIGRCYHRGLRVENLLGLQPSFRNTTRSC